MEHEAFETEASVWVDGFIRALVAVTPDIENDRARAVADALWRTQGRAGMAPGAAANVWLDSDY